jgi:succinate dehydrogenase flavin-adding protein (antitoxin of CptAB toxin-antitoxin module)
MTKKQYLINEETFQEWEINTRKLRTLISCMLVAIPQLRIKFKDEVKIWKITPRINRKSHTTFRNTIYYSSRQRAIENQDLFFKVLCHEFIHLLQRKAFGGFFHFIRYTDPQVTSMIVPAIFGTAMIVGGDTVTGLLFYGLTLFLIAPWQSQSRAEMECEAYTMNLAIEQWKYGEIRQKKKDEVIKSLTSPLYYFMIWNKSTAEKLVDKMVESVQDCQKNKPDCFKISKAFNIVFNIIEEEKNK